MFVRAPRERGKLPLPFRSSEDAPPAMGGSGVMGAVRRWGPCWLARWERRALDRSIFPRGLPEKRTTAAGSREPRPRSWLRRGYLLLCRWHMVRLNF